MIVEDGTAFAEQHPRLAYLKAEVSAQWLRLEHGRRSIPLTAEFIDLTHYKGVGHRPMRGET